MSNPIKVPTRSSRNESPSQSPALVCAEIRILEAGHFRKREDMSRVDYRNVNGECAGCTAPIIAATAREVLRVQLGLGSALGKATAARLYKLSRQLKNSDVREPERLASAAKLGSTVYKQLHDELLGTEKSSKAA